MKCAQGADSPLWEWLPRAKAGGIHRAMETKHIVDNESMEIMTGHNRSTYFTSSLLSRS